MVLVHGLYDTRTSFLSTPEVDYLKDALEAQGFEVQTWEYPNDGATMAAYLQGRFNVDDTGANVLQEWEDSFAGLAETFLFDKPTYLVGYSWGGLMAIHMLESFALDGAFLHVPATDPNFLTEFASYGLSALAALPTTRASLVPVYAAWALDDTRVGYLATDAWASAVGAVENAYAVLGHNTTYATQDALLAQTDLLP